MRNLHRHERDNRNKREWTRLARVWKWAEQVEADLGGPRVNLRSALDPRGEYRLPYRLKTTGSAAAL